MEQSLRLIHMPLPRSSALLLRWRRRSRPCLSASSMAGGRSKCTAYRTLATTVGKGNLLMVKSAGLDTSRHQLLGSVVLGMFKSASPCSCPYQALSQAAGDRAPRRPEEWTQQWLSHADLAVVLHLQREGIFDGGVGVAWILAGLSTFSAPLCLLGGCYLCHSPAHAKSCGS